MRPKQKSTDWKKKIKDICPCFMSELQKPEPSHEPCPVKCPIEELKLLLLQIEIPSRKEIIKAMVKSGVFKKREITFAIVQIYNSIFLSASRRVEEAVEELKAEGWKVGLDDMQCLKAWKETTTDEQSIHM